VFNRLAVVVVVHRKVIIRNDVERAVNSEEEEMKIKLCGITQTVANKKKDK